ncbi:MAG: Ig-like domain-containing protein [Pseudomonas sp.]
MNTSAIVVSLVGQAWAQTANGSRRELRVGDRLRGDEMLITAPGARADLDFGDNRILSFVGEPSAPSEIAVAAAEPLTTAPAPLQIESAPAPSVKDQRAAADAPLSEGHDFVQLVRIAQTIEADGITPLTVARIRELLRPMGMSLPERDFGTDEWREHRGGDRHEDGPAARTPGLSVELQGAGADGVYSLAEIGPDGSVSARIILDDQVREGDILVVRDDNGNELLNRPVTAAELVSGVVIEVPVAPGQGQVVVEATVTTPNGVSASDNDDKPVDNLPPALAAILDQAHFDADSLGFDLSQFFSDNSPLSFSINGLPSGLTIDQATGWVTGTLDRAASQGGTGGEHKVTITATDAAGNSTSHTFNWKVENPAPVAADDSATTVEDTPVSGNVLTGVGSADPAASADSDPDGDDLSVVQFQVAGDSTVYSAGDTANISGVGDLKLNADGSYTFTPAPDWNGTVPSVTYTISDGEGGSDSAELNIVVTPVNDAPVALTPASPLDQVNEDADSVTTLTLDLANLFNDIDDATLNYSISGLPAGLSFDPATGAITGSIDNSASQGGPNADGIYTVTLTATDADGETATQTFSWTVRNPAPVAADDSATTAEDTPVSGNVLGNDHDPDGDALTVTEFVVAGDSMIYGAGDTVNIPGVGDLQLNANGSYTLIPAPNWNGTVPSVTYTISDGEGGSDTAELDIVVTPVNDAPNIVPEDHNGAGITGQVTVEERGLADSDGSQVASGNIAINADDGLQSLTIGGTTVTLAQLKALDGAPITISTPQGELTLTGFTVTSEVGGVATAGTLQYDYELTQVQSTPGADSNTETISLAVTDAGGELATGDLIINILDDAPTAFDQPAVTLAEGGNIVGSASAADNLLDGDRSGADGARVYKFKYLDVNGVEQESAAIAAGDSITVTTQHGGSLTVHSNGDWSYTSPPVSGTGVSAGHGAPGSATDFDLGADFHYQLIDGDGDISGWATQPISVTDTAPSIDTPDNARVDEKHLSSGSAPDSNELTVTGGLGVSKAADAIDTRFGQATLDALDTLGLKAYGDDLTYVIGNDGHTLTATANGQTIFTATITDPGSMAAAYEFVLSGALAHGSLSEIDLVFPYEVVDADGDSDNSSFTVTVIDDAPSLDQAIEVDEDADIIINTTADGTPDSIKVNGDNGSQAPEHGTVNVDANGRITYTPNPDYSGSDSFTYVILEEDGNSRTITVNVTVKPLADAPELDVDTTSVTTDEDVAVILGLNAPQATDTLDQNGADSGDNPELLGMITLTGIPAGTKLLDGSNGDAELFVSTGGPITIVLSNGQHVAGLSGNTLTLTTAQYEALKALPPAEDHRNFTVEVSVTSYEVDASGMPLPGVAGATSNTSVTVEVQAVTDPLELKINGGDSHTLSIAEDSTVNLKDLLTVNYPNTDGNTSADIDGSEERWFEITGLPVGSTVVSGTTTVTVTSSDQVVRVAAPGLSTSAGDLPDILVTPPSDYSASSVDVTVTLKGLDHDADGPSDKGAVVLDSVTLALGVTPIVDELGALGVETKEDTEVKFLQNVTPGDHDGSENITSIVIKGIPADWVVKDHLGNELTPSSGELVISSADISNGNYLNYTITPPAHSSLDTTLKLDIGVTDQGYAGNLSPDVKVFTDVDLDITVTPVAEQTDSDSADPAGMDVEMTAGRSYTTPGTEDEWFNLGVEDTFNLKDGWSNEDSSSEKTFALLTPELVAGDGSQSNALGSQFRYSTDGGSTWVTQAYGGDPIEVPVEYLHTLEFLAPPNFSGMFKIQVEALTRDYDEDDLGGRTVDQLTPGELAALGYNQAITGGAELSNILIRPVADAVTTTVNAHVRGNEDDSMALSIRPSSSDPSETFNVTISGIPEGAKLFYDGVELSLVDKGDGTRMVTIVNFDPEKGAAMTITPPPNSNEPFSLKVSTVSVDHLVIPGIPGFEGHPESSSHDLEILVSPKGVADSANVEIAPLAERSFTEAAVDSVGGIQLSELIRSVSLVDNDGSETLSFKISGLPAGFSIEGATRVGDGEWSLTAAQLLNAKLVTPPNFNGTASFDFAVVTTENDGDSLTELHDVSVWVQPSPEATINLASDLDEDVSTKLDFSIQHRNGDTDERLDAVWIKASDVDAAGNFSLTYGLNGDSLAAVAGKQPGIVLDGDWYKLSGAALHSIYAKGQENWHGTAGFDVRYLITDPAAPAADVSVSDQQQGFDGRYQITVSPVTDQPTLAVTEGEATTLTNAGAVTVKLQVGNSGGDYDGSEQLTRIVLDNVPQGVIVHGASYLGGDRWLLLPGTAFNGQLLQELTLQVHGAAGGLLDHRIRVTVISEDSGNGQPLTASTEISLTTDFGPGSPELPARIEQWEQSAFEPSEDSAFTLEEAINARIEDGVQDNGFTVTLSGLPEGAVVTGMIRTVINGQEVWTASGSGGNAELQNLLAGIRVTPPADWNRHDGDFTYDAKLTTYIPNGTRDEAEITLQQEVLPVTDEADIQIDAPAVAEGSELAIGIDIGNLADDPNWTLIDGKLYLTLNEPVDMQGGILKDAQSNPLSKTAVSGVSGLPDGDYYVIDMAPDSSRLDLLYTPKDGHVSGSISLTATVRGQETGSSLVESTTVNATGQITPINSGYDFTVATTVGAENPHAQAAADRSNVIRLALTDNGLVDGDGSESLGAILLKNLPVGFLVFVGDDAASATLASLGNNLGGAAGSNTWLLGEGAMPGYIGILPPAHWSGTLSDLQLVINSGESALGGSLASTQDFTLTVTPVADGIKLTPTPSFGKEGEIIRLNLNAEMKDLGAAPAGAVDESVETITLQFKGLGEHAAFYLDDQLLSGTLLDGVPRVSYENGIYTIVGLSQEEAGLLGFVQAGKAVDDLQVRAQTVEEGSPEQPSDWTHAGGVDWAKIPTTINSQFGTTTDDRLLWTGEAIDGRGGNDTVQLRFDESLSGADLDSKLANVEAIDLRGAGQNSITSLSIQDVLGMTDSDNTLRILGDDGDSVSLDAAWGQGVQQGDFLVYSALQGGETIRLEVASVLVD